MFSSLPLLLVSQVVDMSKWKITDDGMSQDILSGWDEQFPSWFLWGHCVLLGIHKSLTLGKYYDRHNTSASPTRKYDQVLFKLN